MIKPIDSISKELEKANFQQLFLHDPEHKTSSMNEIKKQQRQVNRRGWLWRKKVPARRKKVNEPKTQIVSFQKAMKLLIITGQCLGLNPVAGGLQTDASKMRFSIFNWRCTHCILIGGAQTIGMTLTLYRLFRRPITIGSLGYFSFYLTTCLTTFLSINLGKNWPGLMKQLSNSSLNEYIDPNLTMKCYACCIIILLLASGWDQNVPAPRHEPSHWQVNTNIFSRITKTGNFEHVLSLISNISRIMGCHTSSDIYGEFLKSYFGWYYDVGLPDYKVLGASLQVLNVISTLNWNYSDMFVMCISLYLQSILAKINKKIIAASEKHNLPSVYWRSLREDYNEAVQLVRSFDDVISGVVFISFASNLLFICLQLYNILVHGLGNGFNYSQNQCPKQDISFRPFGGYEYTVYLSFSVIYLLVRSLVVSITAAGVNTASLVPASALYNVPSSSYSFEVARFIDQVHEDNVALSGLNFFYVTRQLVLSVARFIDQVHEDNVALSGLNFFYVTRQLVLSVAGTIVTYELVLLQVSGDVIH